MTDEEEFKRDIISAPRSVYKALTYRDEQIAALLAEAERLRVEVMQLRVEKARWLFNKTALREIAQSVATFEVDNQSMRAFLRIQTKARALLANEGAK